MPELPEVESARRYLEAQLGAAPLQAVQILDPGVGRPRVSTRASEGRAEVGAALAAALSGRPWPAVRRHGKRLGFETPEGAWTLWLGMSGRFQRGPSPPAHARLGLVPAAGEPVWFVDPRRFGGFAPVNGPLDAALREGHGPDPTLDPWSGAILRARLAGRRPLKVALLDQAVLAGLGNIHAVEALFRARIAPDVPAGALTSEEVEDLAAAIATQLAIGVAELGEAELELVSEGGPNPFQVYGKEGLPCPRTGAPIVRDVHAGRGTWWSPAWQTRGADRRLAFKVETD